MSDIAFRPVIYLKEGCPFCLKVRLFLLEAGLSDSVEMRAFLPGEPEEKVIRDELYSRLEKVSFPAAEMAPGSYIADSDAIVGTLAEQAGRDPADLPVYSAYLTAALKPMMALFKENMALSAVAA